MATENEPKAPEEKAPEPQLPIADPSIKQRPTEKIEGGWRGPEFKALNNNE